MRYFGTDGIRGKVGGGLIQENFVRRFGYALAAFLKKHNQAKPITVAIGRDTRQSGDMLQSALCEGMCANGIHVIFLGVTPSPAVSMAVRDLHADLGISITASHNPGTDNGIKLFDNRGLKFSLHAEEEIENFVDAQPDIPKKNLTDCAFNHDSTGYYTNYMRSLMHQDGLKGWTIVLDTANGAAYQTSEDVFNHFGANLIRLGDTPDGTNINLNLGSEHPQQMCQKVLETGAKLGIAHDGDADRVVFCDETGSVLTGEEVLCMLALELKQQNALAKDTIVTTIQSNLGLDHSLSQNNISTIRVPVGDRNVLIALNEAHLNFGGESSGHYLLFEHSVSGDGLLAAIKVVEMMQRQGRPLSELRQCMKAYPQLIRNLEVTEKKPLESCPELQSAIEQLELELGDQGRLLVRYSGTEPKLRFLVEGRDASVIDDVMARLVTAAGKDLYHFEKRMSE